MLKEEVLNVEIGKLLRKHLYDAKTRIEENGQLEDELKRPDIVIEKGGREPVLVENKIDEDRKLTEQCEERLQHKWVNGNQVKAVVGLLSPKSLAENGDLKQISNEESFRWATWSSAFGRFPENGWLQGSILDFASFIDRVGANSIDIDELITKIRIALQQASLVINKDEETSKQFSKILKQKSGEQTNRMGLAMIFNAIVFQSHVARHHSKISSPSQISGDKDVSQAHISQIWNEILKIDYSPIFYIARELLQSIADTRTADAVLGRIFTTAISVAKEAGAQGLIGTIFGELISDRKLLASFYTMPQSSALMAELAVSCMDIDWSKKQAVQQLKVGDLAVGTGTLLVATYKRIAERHLLSSNNPAGLHRAMMENVMIGCDIDPSAVHITASRLSGEYPDIDYYNTQTYVMPYGYVKLKRGAKDYKLGSLDLFVAAPQKSLFGSGLEALGPSATESHSDINIPHESLDLVIMNPPFTRPTNHEVFKEGFPNPAFAGLGTNEEDQKCMSRILKSHLANLPKPQASHGNAGLASNFIDLSHAKLKPGGVLALIIPATVISGNAWSNTRELLSRHYHGITVVTISAKGSQNRNWSADTSLNETIVIAHKNKKGEVGEGDNKARFVTLNKRPDTITEAVEIGGILNKSRSDGYIKLGDDHIGWVVTGSFGRKNIGHPGSVKSLDLAIFANKLISGSISLPQMHEINLPIVMLGCLGNTGPLHRDITGLHSDSSHRGAFDKHELSNRDAYGQVSYPIIWNHDAEQERTILVKPDSEGKIRPDMKERALSIWKGYEGSNRGMAGATKLHINLDFRMSSQSLGACLTPCRAIGGYAWPSFQFTDTKNLDIYEKAMAIWMNTTLGLISRWWVSSRQQPGRSRLGVSSMANIPVLDLKQLSEKQLRKLSSLSEQYGSEGLKPACMADLDHIRQAIDRAVLCDVLGLPQGIHHPLDIIRRKWCIEPSVMGGRRKADD